VEGLRRWNLIENRAYSRHIASMQPVFTGTVYVVCDNTDTDQIIPAPNPMLIL
jgi:hypothetical protein